MKRIALLLALLALFGCASDPLVTGKPQDWKGRAAADLRTAMGTPTRIITAANGDEIWEYYLSRDRMIPKGESMNFSFGGLGSTAGGAGGFASEKRPEDRLSRVEQLRRFKIHKGKVTEWYAANIVDGRTVWEDH